MNSFFIRFSLQIFIILSLYPIFLSIYAVDGQVLLWIKDVADVIVRFLEMPRHALFSVAIYVIAAVSLISAVFVPANENITKKILDTYRKTNFFGIFCYPLLFGVLTLILGGAVNFSHNWIFNYRYPWIAAFLVGYIILLIVFFYLNRVANLSLTWEQKTRRLGQHLLIAVILGITFLIMKPEGRTYHYDHISSTLRQESQGKLIESIAHGLDKARYDNVQFRLADLVEMRPYQSGELSVTPECNPFGLRKYIDIIGLDFPDIRKREDLLYMKWYGDEKINSVPQMCAIAIAKRDFVVRAEFFVKAVKDACQRGILYSC